MTRKRSERPRDLLLAQWRLDTRLRHAPPMPPTGGAGRDLLGFICAQ